MNFNVFFFVINKIKEFYGLVYCYDNLICYGSYGLLKECFVKLGEIEGIYSYMFEKMILDIVIFNVVMYQGDKCYKMVE